MHKHAGQNLADPSPKSGAAYLLAMSSHVGSGTGPTRQAPTTRCTFAAEPLRLPGLEAQSPPRQFS